ncbi:hypothetical protein IDJ77_20850 [Mucilaginibacter sp. ZT4R22]|uniref:Uncharacterized protein n=1 Tax=Mucilaginibacter pankratovii TaxID=2772110 RepID=A0ABR7WXV5_9SPHI|nr:hypothetical protein [Mucilaginibacter pankratovii]MBD1366274.1 hypothetical protein [Mucilaginibacter pankratovii]
MKKAIVLKALNNLKDDFDVEQLIEQMFFIEKIEKGLSDVKEGRVLSYKETKRRFSNK